jgi:hypothetical protein
MPDLNGLMASEREAEELRRKDFVRKYVLRVEAQRKIPPRSRGPNAELRNGIKAVFNDIYGTTQGRLTVIRQANLAWQQKLLMEAKDRKQVFGYDDMKAFIIARGWEREWLPRRLCALWASECRRWKI